MGSDLGQTDDDALCHGHRADDDVTHPILEGGACVVLFCSVVVVVVFCCCFFCPTSQHSLKLVARLKWSACAESACVRERNRLRERDGGSRIELELTKLENFNTQD